MSDLPKIDLLDIDETDQMRGVLRGWGLSSTQLEPGTQQSFHDQLVFDDLQVMHFRESRQIAHEYCLPPDTTAFCLFTPSSPLQRWCGIELPHQVALVHPSGCGYLSWYPSGFRSIGLVVANSVLDTFDLTPPRWRDSQRISTRCMIPLSVAGRTFADWLFRVCGSRGDLRLLAKDPVAATLFRDRVFTGLGALLGHNSQPKHGPAVQSSFCRYRLVREALELIDHKLSQPLSTSDIASELNVSPRLLQYAFRDTMQASPHEFVLKRKLHAARLRLIRNPASRSRVTEAALAFGFTELGRFSQRYRQMFGESPSSTR